MTQNQYKTLFFDLDRTLWDFDANSLATLKVLFDEFNLSESISRFEKFIKVYEKENFRLWDMYRKAKVTQEDVKHLRFSRTLHHFGVDSKQGQAMGKRYLEVLAEQVILFPDTLPVLEHLQGKYKLAIITNGFEEVQQKKMKNSGLAVFFDHLITSEDAGALKPDPRIFEKALQLTDTKPEEALMIGDDHKADILGAKRMGIDQVWFKSHSTKRGDASFLINELKELVSIVHL